MDIIIKVHFAVVVVSIVLKDDNPRKNEKVNTDVDLNGSLCSYVVVVEVDKGDSVEGKVPDIL